MEVFMKPFSITIRTLGILAILIPAPATAQHYFDLRPELTKEEFKEFTAGVGSILRFRQFADAATLGKGAVDLSVQFASPSVDDSTWAWNDTALPVLVARFGVGDRVDVGASAGFNSRSNYGLAGIDTKIDLSISRAVGNLSPYAGVGTNGSLAFERLKDVDLDPAAAERSLAYAGISCRWRALHVSAEVEKAAVVSYGFRVGTRF
jgi:hypothetical protein